MPSNGAGCPHTPLRPSLLKFPTRPSFGNETFPVSEADARYWTLGDLKFRGNVGHISHGKTVNSETLGGSDGTTPFLRFQLKEKPLIWLANPTIAPELQVQVNGLTWTRGHDGSPPLYDTGVLVSRCRAHLGKLFLPVT